MQSVLLQLLLLLLLSAAVLHAQPQSPDKSAPPRPKVEREFRAAWIATVDNIDFPSRRNLSPDQQKQELLESLDLAQKLRLNAVVFQVRPMADAVYRSRLEPWSEFLTGQMGKAQDFDPLAFLVTEAHRRGILVHAWFNPYRAFHPSAKTISDYHISKTHPEFVRDYGRYKWLDPTDAAAQRHSLEVIKDVVRRYDVDGVHFDDYFYPYAEKDAAGNKIEFPDEQNWLTYQNRDGKLSRGDWRRDQVNRFIEAVGREIKRIRPDVVYGISPFGIWQPEPEKGIKGFNAFAELYADARKWLQDGTVDYLAPQLYWETAREGQSFPVLLAWWRSQNTKRRFIWPGIAAYRIGSTKTFTAGEIADQIETTRRSPETTGAIFFSFKSLRSDMGGIQSELRDRVYRRDAVVPNFSWIKTKKISPPKVTISRDRQFVRVRWSERGARRAFWFVIYVKDKDGWSYTVLPASERSIALSADRKIESVFVSAVDRLGNESR
ncbi:MAG: glycoside hydrolase family 10 protein [Pyrinomonadaceae bacterium]